MIKFKDNNELEDKLCSVFGIWGICHKTSASPNSLAELVSSRIDFDSLNDEKVIKKNIEDVVIEYLVDKKEYLLDLDIILKLIFEDESNYLNILKSYNVLDNLIDYYDYPLIKEIQSKINDDTTICIFSELYKEKPMLRFYIYHTNVMSVKPIRPILYDLTRTYFVEDESNKMENIYLALSNDGFLTKLSALNIARYLKMKEFYYRDKYEEGIINTTTGILTPKKNKGIVIDKNNATLLQGFTSIDIFTNYDKNTYKAYDSKNKDNIVDFNFTEGSKSNLFSDNKRKRINEMINNATFY